MIETNFLQVKESKTEKKYWNRAGVVFEEKWF